VTVTTLPAGIGVPAGSRPGSGTEPARGRDHEYVAFAGGMRPGAVWSLPRLTKAA